MTDEQPETPAPEPLPAAVTPAPQPEPLLEQASGKRRIAISRAVTWLLARARVDWLAQEHDASVERWNQAFQRADDLRQRCVRGEDVGFEWVTQLGVALAHAERALETGNDAVEGAHATGQTELADRLSQTVSDNRESWAAERTRHSLLVASPLALNCG